MDTLQYKDIFISEAIEYLEHLNQDLLALEKNPSDQNSLNEIFRTSHTMKSMAATMGFDQITELTHQMENVLDKLRTGRQEVLSGTIDVLFECLDTLSLLIEEISSAEPKNIELNKLLEKLKSLESGKREAEVDDQACRLSAGNSPKEDETAAAAVLLDNLEKLAAQARTEGYLTYGVKVRLEESCSFKGVRAFMAYKTLTAHGEVIASFPATQKLQEGMFEREFLLVVLTQRGEELLDRGLKSVSEIESFELKVLESGEMKEFFGALRPVAGNAAPVKAPEANQRKEPITGRLIQSIRVSVERLDNLQNLIGELVINKIRLTQLAKQYELKDLKEALTQFDRVTSELQDEVTEVRMVPMEHVFNRFPRMVRDIAKESGKEIELEMEGKDIELDRTVLDEINDPLVHLLRNAVDHGIEEVESRCQSGKKRQGLIRLAATRKKNHVIIQVTDDGQGIDPAETRRIAVEKGFMNFEEAERLTDQEAVNLISLPGFTTVDEVTEISGRGVGVDAVRSKIVSFGGDLRIESKPGKGSTFTLRMPMTLAIIQALLIRVSREVYAIPVINTMETLVFSEIQLKHVQQGEVVMYRDKVLPLLRLHRVLNTPEEDRPEPERAVLVVEAGETQIGLLVDEVLGQQEIAIKSMSAMLKGVRGLSGVTILGDGRIALVLDVPSLI